MKTENEKVKKKVELKCIINKEKYIEIKHMLIIWARVTVRFIAFPQDSLKQASFVSVWDLQTGRNIISI